MTDKMLAWRHQMEQMFQFNPAQGVPRTDLQTLEMKYAQKRSQSERILEQGSHELRKITNAGKGEVERLDSAIARLEYEVAQLSADLRVFDSIPWWE